MDILSPDEVKAVLAAMRDTPVFAEVVVLLSTGARRGELMGLKWGDLDLDAGKVGIERSIEKTNAACGSKRPRPARTPAHHPARVRGRGAARAS